MTFNTELWNGQAPGAGGYQIERSLRFNSSDSAYLSRTIASAGNRKTWTYSVWVKLGKLDLAYPTIFSNSATNDDYIAVSATANSNIIRWRGGTLTLHTQSVLRDPSAWYHLCFVADTTQAISTDRAKIYINGVQQTALSIATYWAQDYEGRINDAGDHLISQYQLTKGLFDGYLADIHFIDGQALNPASFGEFDTNGIWQPKAYSSGSYGTNGFHLDFSDNSTATALGTDTSGNGNNWTVNNISVAAGAGNDSLVDVPTNGTESDTGLGGEVRGNYCTWNPLASPWVLSNGNLVGQAPTTLNRSYVEATIYVDSGKWYAEFVGDISRIQIAIVHPGGNPNEYIGFNNDGSVSYDPGIDRKFENGSQYDSYFGQTFSAGDIFGLALDLDAGTFDFYANGVLIGELASGLSGLYTFAAGDPTNTPEPTVTANFGQRPFAYTAPSGFKALCTANLPSTTITTSGSYTGNGVADGPFVYLNGVPTAMTIGGNSVTFGTDADKLSNGFKIRTTSTTYNQNANTYNYTITSTGDPFKTARAQSNP